MTAPTGLERLSLETMPIAPPRQSTSQSGAASINIGGHTTESSESDDTSTDEDEVVYIRTQKPVTTEDDSDTSVDNTRPRSTLDKQEKPPDTQLHWNDEGFPTVRTRQERRQRRSQTPSMLSADRKIPATQYRENPKQVVSIVKTNVPPTEIRITAKRDDYSNMEEHVLQLPVQMDTLTKILQERLEEMTAQIDRREQQLIEKLKNAEDRLHKNERKASTERQHHRNYLNQTMKRLEDWEENLRQREQMIERNRKMLHTQYERYTNQYTEWQTQAERAITAWHEVAQTTLKETLDDTIQQQTAKIDDFATDQEQKLMSLLDGYEEHARGIQAKLLARFHADMTQKYTEVHTMERQQAAIPLDEDEAPSLRTDPGVKSSTNEDDSTHPGQTKATRWIHVNPDEIKQGGQRQSYYPPENEAAPMEPHRNNPPGLVADTNRTEGASPRSTGAATQYPVADYHQLARLRAATTPSQLCGRDRKSVCIFYNSFVDFNRIYRIPLKILDDIRLDCLDDEDENLFPTGLREQDPQL